MAARPTSSTKAWVSQTRAWSKMAVDILSSVWPLISRRSAVTGSNATRPRRQRR